MMYITFFLDFHNWKFDLLISFTYFACPLIHLPSFNHQFVLCVSESVPGSFYILIQHKN